ncbi:MAG: AraC family transcriptional regulator ligand-binding domain-containing protein [Acidobacteriota bacterium]
MGWISAVFAHKMISFAIDAGLEGEALRSRAPNPQRVRVRLLRAVGLDPESVVDPERMITDTDFFALLERIAEEVEGGRSVPLRVGASMRCDDYGAFGLAFKSAIDLESSYLRVERYGRVVTSISNFRLVEAEDLESADVEGADMEGADSVFMEVIPGEIDRLGLRMTNELALGAATALSREVGQQGFAPLAVHISHSTPEDVSAFEAHFRCPLCFDARRDALEVSREQLRQPNRLGDTSISRFFDTHLEDALAHLPGDQDLGRRVRAEIAQALSEGVPRLPRLAARLGMSARTLQRRLGEASLSYRDLVDQARRELADHLLRKTDYGLAEIAFLTGFSEQSAFNRAFKRWAGKPPRAYRDEARPGMA